MAPGGEGWGVARDVASRDSQNRHGFISALLYHIMPPRITTNARQEAKTPLGPIVTRHKIRVRLNLQHQASQDGPEPPVCRAAALLAGFTPLCVVRRECLVVYSYLTAATRATNHPH